MNTKKIVTILISSAVLALPLLAAAQGVGTLPPVPVVSGSLDFCGLINLLEQIVWVVFTAIVVISFVIAGILFVTSQGSADKVAAARGAVLWGVVGIVVGILAYGIIKIVGSTVGTATTC